MVREKKPGKQSATYEAMKWVLLISGIFGLILGLIHLAAYILSDPSASRFGDAFVNGLVGILSLVCWQLLIARRGLVIVVYFLAITLSLGYSLSAGRGFNPIAAGFGLIILLQLIILKRAGELESQPPGDQSTISEE